MKTIARTISAFGCIMVLAAAAPDGMSVELADVGPLAKPETAPAKVLTFQNSMYQAAPVPDEDVAAPPGAIQTEPQVAPRMLSAAPLFQGDGYANGSSQQATLDRRKAAAAGLGLSVPVN